MQEKLQTNENKKKGQKKEEKKKKLGASIYSSNFDENWSVQWPFIQPVQGTFTHSIALFVVSKVVAVIKVCMYYKQA